jgi:hypothetical protein
MIYNKIYDLCKIRNVGPFMENGLDPTPRVRFIMDLLEKVGIEYELDVWPYDDENNLFNIIMKGTSDKFVVAHHDINNPSSDNANDNSASCINVIATKLMRPDVNAAILDGEEFGGKGSQRLSDQINRGDFGSITWVLNYELTGLGGENFFIGNYPGALFDQIKSTFNCPVIHTPFNDSVIFRRNGIDSVVINPCPILKGDKLRNYLYRKYGPLEDDEIEMYIDKAKEDPQCVFNENGILDISILYLCHSPKDSVSNMSTTDMRSFVEKIVSRII